MKKWSMKPFFQILLMTLLLNISIASLVAQEGKSLPQPNAFIQKGLEDLKSQNYDQAALEFRQAIRADPKNGLAYALLGLSLAQLKRYKDAIEPLEKSLSLNPHPQWGAITEKMVRDLLAEVKHNAKITPAQVRCQDDEFSASSSAVQEFADDESREAVPILIQSFHSETTARAVVARIRAYADDSPYSYSAILRITERLAIKDFCGAEILHIIKSCGDVVAALSGTDVDLADVVLSIAELKSTEAEGYIILSDLDNRGIPVFNLLGRITGKTSDSIKQAALHNQLDFRFVYGACCWKDLIKAMAV